MSFYVRSNGLWVPSTPRVRAGGMWLPEPGPSIPTRYVHTESSGGDGTSFALSGSQAAFSSLAEAVASLAGEEGDWLIRVAGGADTEAVVFAGNNWGDRHVIVQVEPSSRMGAKWDSTKYHIAVSNADGIDNATSGISNLTLRGVAVQLNLSSGGSADAMDLRGPSTAGTIIVDGVFVRLVVAAGNTATPRGLRVGGAQRDMVIMNSITWAEDPEGGTRGIDVASGSKVGGIQIYNHTSVGNGRGYGFSSAAETLIMNSIAYGNVDSRNGTPHSSSDYNVSDDGDFGNTNDDTGAVLFVDAENGDFRLHANDTMARGQGTDLSSVGVTHDIAGNLRTVPFDRGASQE